MAITKVALKTNHLSLYLENDKGMVFNHVNHCLFHLPAVSIALLLAIDEYSDEKQALEYVVQNSNIPLKKLQPLYHKIAQLFNRQQEQSTYLDGRYPEVFQSVGKHKLQSSNKITTYKIANVTFLISVESPVLQNEIEKLLHPCKHNLTEVDVVISIRNTKQGNSDSFELFSHDLLINEKLTFAEVMPELIDRLQIIAFQKSDYRFCFHGAALQTPDGNLLLPGKSGAGKSTLSAFLTYNNNGLFSDEMIVLDENFNVKVLTLPIAIKSGSWHILQPYFPELTQASIWHRLDGRQLKYVWPTTFADQSFKTNALLVNPNFIHLTESSLPEGELPKAEALTVIDTIEMLTQGGYQLGFELNTTKLEQLIHFLTQTKCYTLSYTSNEQAQMKLKHLW